MMQPITLDDAARALSFVPPDVRDTWIKMGMAIKSEFGDAAKDVWKNWSAASDDFNSGAAEASWKSFKDGGKIGIGTLLAEAKRHGFVLERSEIVVSPEKLAADKAAREERAAKAEQDRLARAAAAANRAQSQWRMAAVEGESPYLQRKKVVAEACRFLPDGGLVIPMMRYDFDKPVMVGKQSIAADGTKKYSGGMDKHGAACRLGNVPVDGDTILVVEGYATGLSVRMAIGYSLAVFVAFDTSGLLPVAQILRTKYPNSRIVFCADDDYLTGGSGVEKAKAAAIAVQPASVFLPRFSVKRRVDKKDESLPMLTDFNDLHCAESLDEVARQLSDSAYLYFSSLDASPSPSDDMTEMPPDALSPPPFDEATGAPVAEFKRPEMASLLEHFAVIWGSTDVWDGLNRQRIKKAAFVSSVGKDLARQWLEHDNRRTIDADSLPMLKRGRAVDGAGGGGDRLTEMLEKITLLYGTVTVWDSEKRMVMALDAMRAAYGPDMTKRWQEHALRAMIDADNLVFDPTQRVSPETHINMFAGFPLVPKQDDEKCVPVLDLIFELCGAEENAVAVGDWLLKWLAYPLQHPGAKMQTAVLMFGEKQGTGKSLFFEGIMRPIYGEYGGTAGQHQLDSSFTDWKSKKIYMVFEEVLSRDDRYSHIGTLKHMITGRDMRVNPKNLPERIEANHLNAVFLSNESQPIPIELEDRRWLVIEARNRLTEEFLSKMKKLMKDGVSEAFYHFLLNYPLGDFDEHTKPLMTEAKRKIIRFGRPGWDAFHSAWKDGDLSVPYSSCLSSDLYIIYLRWCERNHEKRLSLTKFSELLAGREDKVKKHVTMGQAKKTKMVFQINGADGNELSNQCQEFRRLADINDEF